MGSVKHTVKVEVANTPTAKRLDVSQRLMDCGEIHGLYPCKNTNPGSPHYFVEFKHTGSVERALRLKLNHARVYSLVMNPSLAKEFFSVAPSSSDQPRQSPKSSPTSANPKPGESESVPSKHRPQRSDPPPDANAAASSASQLTTQVHLPSPTESIFQSLKSSPTLIPKRNNNSETSQQEPASDHSHRPNELRIPPSISLENAISLPTPISPATAPSVPAGPLSSLEKHIVMSLCGENITYDLGALEDDPKVIIQLLKATSSERGNWLTVAGQYRRNKNPTAALSVVTELVQSLTQRGVPEGDLKPAFLLLSGCEADLAKRAKAFETSVEHYKKAQQWLQKVYGTQSPDRVGCEHHEDSRPRSTSPSGHPRTSPSNVSSTPAVTKVPRKRGSQCEDPPTSNNNDNKDNNENNSTKSPSKSHLNVLKREIQALRDRQGEQAAMLADIRSAKRKLEDDFASERAFRRKLERNLDEAERALELALKRERYAFDLQRKEVAARRRAEQRAEEEADWRRELEMLLASRATNPVLEDLANLCQPLERMSGGPYGHVPGHG